MPAYFNYCTNYRAVAISNAVTKILESVLFCHVNNCLAQTDMQFGFKEAHSTSLCTYAVKETVEYYTTRGSHVFACFVDLSKAFDKVNYWKMFSLLLADGVQNGIVALLAYWYSQQLISVRWRSVTSSAFTVGNGTRQGGILSPCLFNRYIYDLLLLVSRQKVGCNIGGVFANVFAYADDIVLLAPSWQALQALLRVLENGILAIDMSCNTRKTVCMVFSPRQKRKVVSPHFPPLRLFGTDLLYVDNFKYLGHIIDNKLNDDADIQREIRNLFTRANILTRRFSLCSQSVKVALFKSYCISLYGCALWRNHTVSSLSKLRSCYHRCVKTFFGYKRHDSMTAVLFKLSIPSFNTLLHNSRCILRSQTVNQ